LIRKLVGEIVLTPTDPGEDDGGGNGKPYYTAECDVMVLPILEGTDKGANWLQWWRKRYPYRNAGDLLF